MANLRIEMMGSRNGVRRGGAADRRPLLLIAGGVGIAVILMAAIWQIGGEDPASTQRRRTVDLDRIVIPTVPTREELEDPATSLDRDALAGLREGASVQVADENGRLAQEYGAARIDPLPDSWMEMDRPWARIHGSGGRFVEMEAIKGTMRVPDQALESGRLNGDVRIRLFEPGDDPATGKPSVVITAEDAEYDAGVGEIRSRERVEVVTADAIFVGEDLRIVLGDDASRIERLTVERALEPIRIQPGRQLVAAGPVVSSDEPVDVAEAAGDRRAATPPVGSSTPQASAGSDDRDVERIDPDSVYRLVLEDDVVIERRTLGADGTSRRGTVEGDRLVAFFLLGESKEGDDLFSAADQVEPIGTSLPSTPSSMIAANVLTATDVVAPADRDDDVILVHYEGRLVMTPDPTAADRLGSARDSILLVDGLEGRGIRFQDETNEAVGTALQLQYRTGTDRVELVGNDVHPLRIASPRFTLDGGRFWFERGRGVGGLVGPGRMTMAQDANDSLQAAIDGGVLGTDLMIDRMLADASRRSSAPLMSAVLAAFDSTGQDATEDDPPQLEIVWEGGVDLDFLEGSDTRLQQARFNGDVRVAGDAFRLGSDSLVVDFDPEGEADAIDRILAAGNARVDRVGESGSLQASKIDLGLVRTEDGRTIPGKMVAQGGVAARDPSQTLWTERLVVTFREADGDEAGDRGLAGGLAGGLVDGSARDGVGGA
ncbi:MAG: hypothetical protein GY895_06595, partial [Phycisphaera sp.]|nr:hypothetical protein [Phycisphaera sp.]